jgi:hypothetical protein
VGAAVAQAPAPFPLSSLLSSHLSRTLLCDSWATSGNASPRSSTTRRQRACAGQSRRAFGRREAAAACAAACSPAAATASAAAAQGEAAKVVMVSDASVKRLERKRGWVADGGSLAAGAAPPLFLSHPYSRPSPAKSTLSLSSPS